MIAPQTADALAQELPGDTRQLMRLVVNQVAAARGLPAPWPIPLGLKDAAERVGKRIAELRDLSGWGAAELGALREQLLPGPDRATAGVWYTPPPVAQFLADATLSLLPTPDFGDPPEAALAVSVLDPACGGGVVLLAAIQPLARRYAALLTGTNTPPAALIADVTPQVMQACLFGIDIDAVAVDLAKSVCWLQTGGTAPITWLDDNIIVGDALAGDLPPRLAARLKGTGPLAIVGNPPFRDKAKGSAPWIEARRPKPGEPRPPDELWRPSLDEFRFPGQGHIEYALSNLHVYFWRWALWRALETRLVPGAVGFLSPSAYLKGAAFAGMRAHIRCHTDLGYVIDLTPEGTQPPTPTRIFPGVAQPLAIGMFTRTGPPNPDQSAVIRHTTVTGDRDAKIQQLHQLLTLGPPPTAQPGGSTATEEALLH